MKQGWERINLGEVGKVCMCKRIMKKQTSPTGDIPFYKIGTFGKTANAFINEDIYKEFKEKYSFPNKGDILISASGTIGRRVVYDGEPAYFQDSNIVWIENNEELILNEYLYQFYGVCDWNPSKGATISRLYNDDLRRMKISFPASKVEQKRIVAKLDQCFEAIDKARANVERNLNNAKELFQSKLNQIFSQKGDGFETKLFGDVCEIIGGSQPPKQTFVYQPQEGFVRLIQVRDYRTDKFMTYIPKEKTKKFCSQDDIMIGRYGPPIFGIFSGIDGAYNVALMKAVPDEKLLNKNYFRWFLKNKDLHEFVEKSSARAAGQSGVRKELLYTYPVPIPTKEIQVQIVKQLDELQSQTQSLESNYKQELIALDELKKSILQKAFNGEL